MVLMLKHCCCGCTLKTGALIIAVTFAILSALQAFMFTVIAVVTSDRLYYLETIRLQLMLEAATDPFQHTPGSVPASVTTTAVPSTDDGQGDDTLNIKITLFTIWKWGSIILVVMECTGFVLNVLLMCAANKDSARHVFVWVAGFSAVSCCRLVLHLILTSANFHYQPGMAGLLLIPITLVITAGSAYSALVGYSYYRQLVGTGVARRISQQED